MYTWGGDYDLVKVVARGVARGGRQELCVPLWGDLRSQKAVCVLQKGMRLHLSTTTATNKEVTTILTPITYMYIYVCVCVCAYTHTYT